MKCFQGIYLDSGGSSKKIFRPHKSICSKATKSEIGFILTPFLPTVQLKLDLNTLPWLPYIALHQLDDFRLLKCLNLAFPA